MVENRDGDKVTKYKVRLSSGREVGPIDFGSVAKLIRRGHVTGAEMARRHPVGDWVPIQSIEELAAELASASGSPASEASAPADESEEKTYVGPAPDDFGSASGDAEDATFVGSVEGAGNPSLPVQLEAGLAEVEATPPPAPEPMSVAPHAGEATVFFSKEDLKREGIAPPEGHAAGIPIGPRGDQERNRRSRRILVLGLAVVVIGVLALLTPEPKAPPKFKWDPVRPRLPAMVEASKADPDRSRELYTRGLQAFGKDDIASYRKAVDLFAGAVSADSSNVGAVALLAASYLNLIDVSNKDENYFQVILKLLDLARSAKLELVEVLIADVEYFIAVAKPDAAIAKIGAYAEAHPSRIGDLFLQMGYAQFEKGDLATASKYLAKIPDNLAGTPRVFYLRGQIAERRSDFDSAIREYQRALQLSGDHAKSRLRLADLFVKQNRFDEAAPLLADLVARPALLLPKETARALYLSSMVKKAYNKADDALADIRKAVQVDPESRVYLLESYAQRAAAGKLTPKLERESRMYFLLIDAERLIKEGRHREALVKLMAARSENPESIEPLVEIGNLFMYLNDVTSARYNYEKAAQLAPKDIKVWSKYIHSLILSYDWPEAEKAMAVFRKNPDAGSTVDKAAGDMYARMGRYEEALAFYKKAMARDSIDPEVYLSMANLLMKTRHFDEAPLFYSLALRVDPLNVDAEIGIARAVAETDGLDAGIQLLKSELSKATRARAPFEAAIAELAIRSKEWEIAKDYIAQAQSADPEYAYPWKLLGQVYLGLDGIEKDAIPKALEAFQSYSDRNPSDPSGYMEMFRILAARGEFQKAEEALDKVLQLYPKYPQYHFFKGQLYARQGNHKVAIQEFGSELSSNPGAVPVILALGESLIEAGDFKAAAARFSEAMQLDATNAKAKQLAGYVAYLQKNFTAAVALYQASAALDPNNGLLFKRLGDAYDASGNRELARQAYRKYLQQEPDAPERDKLSRY